MSEYTEPNHVKRSKSLQLLTVITEAAIEARLVSDMESMGAKGYTVVDVRGKGHQGMRAGGWDASANIRVEVICSPAIAESISLYLKETYYDDYGMVVFTSEVGVMRPEKF